MKTLEEIKNIITKYNETLEDYQCTSCSFYDVNKRKNIPSGVWYTPNNEKPVVIVSNYPKEYDQNAGKVMQTSEKEVLKTWIKNCENISFYLTNAFKCITPDDKGVCPSRLSPCNRLYLWRELYTIQPYVVITLGYLSAQALFIKPPSRDDIKDYIINKRIDHSIPKLDPYKEQLNFSLYAITHPAFMQRGGSDSYDECQHLFKTAFNENYNICQKKKTKSQIT